MICEAQRKVCATFLEMFLSKTQSVYAAIVFSAFVWVWAAAPRANPDHYTLTWSDEFNGPDDSTPDPKKWTYDLGGGGWGNQELESYTNRRENARIDHGNLVITARREAFTGADGIAREYTSTRLNSQGLFTQAYGRFEARIKIPQGQGMWPAFWMLGEDFPTAGWPRCGEIDIMENVGKEPGTVHGSLHGPGGQTGVSGATAHDLTKIFSLPGGQRYADDFHVYALEWEPKAARFYSDSNLYATFTPEDMSAGSWVFDHPFFLILNLAIGGDWPGSPDETTTFPAEMRVDYVRVYNRGK
jgi:beta-glucanase (GH16 family)